MDRKKHITDFLARSLCRLPQDRPTACSATATAGTARRWVASHCATRTGGDTTLATTLAADSNCDRVQQDGELRAQGLEPWTHGLKGRCSAD
jgi:hypothetical protein